MKQVLNKSLPRVAVLVPVRGSVSRRGTPVRLGRVPLLPRSSRRRARALRDPELGLLPYARLQRDVAAFALAQARPRVGAPDEGVLAREAQVAGRVAQLAREAVVGARVVGGVAREVGARVRGRGVGEEVLVYLPGEGEVGGDLAEVELEVGPDGGDGVGPCF